MSRLVCMLVFLMGLGCSKDDTIPSDFKAVPSADFGYRVSRNYSGFVSFKSITVGMKTFDWSFGFYKGSGEVAASSDPHPYIWFPMNGEYRVRFTAKDSLDGAYTIEKIVTVNNY